MSVPKISPILGPPPGVDPIGRAYQWREFMRILRGVNAELFAPEPVFVADGHPFSGITTLYIGRPGSTEDGKWMHGRKVCAFQAGMIPEWTIINPLDGGFTRGWRSILDRVILASAATVDQLERAFGVTLRLSPEIQSEWCWRCAYDGEHRRTTGGKSNLCLMHEQAEQNAHNDPAHAAAVRRMKAEWLRSRSKV